MADVIVECRSFCGVYKNLNGVHARNIHRRAILRAIMAVGFQSFSSFLSIGMRGFVHRFGIAISAFSFLERQISGLCISDEYKKLNRSEKAAASYWYGIILAKLVAESELRIPWLAHVDPLIDSGALKVDPTVKRRPDLVGKGLSNDWHVIEAKGRTRKMSLSQVAAAKAQASVVKSVNGLPPATTLACVTSLYAQPITVTLDDPLADTGEISEEWEIDDKKFFRQYYKGIIRYLEEFGLSKSYRVNRLEFITAPLFPFFWEYFGPPFRPYFPEWRLELGLPATIYKKPEQAPDAVRELRIDEDGKIGSDGIAIFGEMPDWEKSFE